MTAVPVSASALFVLLFFSTSPAACAGSIPLDSEILIGAGVPGDVLQAVAPQDSVSIKKLSGNFSLIVILVEFTDIKHKETRDEIHNMVFRRMNKYWREVSYDQFNVIGDTVGWFDIGRDEAFYGKNTDPEDPKSDQRGRELIQDACNLVTGIDFKKYQDIMVVYAGHGQSSDRDRTDLIWPKAYRHDLDVSCGGKRYGSGGWSSEVVKRGEIAFGTFTHEFGHSIGLPDLYNADLDAPDYWETGIDYMGLWSLMGCGSGGGPDRSSPTGLEAWSKMKLGWLAPVSVPLAGDGSVQSLNQLVDPNGPRALKVRASSTIYYLFEARAELGVDEYLPSPGVLITRIDESKESGKGIVRVMDCHPETKSINDATCKMNESWSDTSSGIYTKVLAKQGASHFIAFASRPITTIKGMKGTYSVELLLTGLPSFAANVTVSVDGTEYQVISPAGKATLVFPEGTNHTVSLSECAMVATDARLCATRNELTITKQGKYVIDYDSRQYRLLIQTEPSSISGADEKWLTVGQTETLGPYDEIVPVSADSRYVLVSLVVDGVLHRERSITLRMDQPHVVAVVYTTEYYLGIESEFGDPKGEGWYVSGSVANYSIMTPQGFLIQHVFVSWVGDITSKEPQGTLTMTRPYALRANWRDDHTQLVLVLAALAVLVAAIAVRVRRPRERVWPAVSEQIKPVTPPSIAARRCVSCGELIVQEGLYCEHCGTRQP